MAEEIERMPEEEVRGGLRKGPATAYKKSELGVAVKFPVRPVLADVGLLRGRGFG